MEFKTHAGRNIEREYHKHLVKKYSSVADAVLFNSLNDTDKMAVVWIYGTKVMQNEFPEEIKEDKLRCLEESARVYIAQKCAFSNVLTKEGFDVVSEALKDYDGRISTLSNHGTVSIFGKPVRIGRLVTMKRIHSPRLNYDGFRGQLTQDLKLGGSIYFRDKNEVGFNSSHLRSIAINPHGSSDEGLEVRAARTIIQKVEDETLTNSRLPLKKLLEIQVYKE